MNSFGNQFRIHIFGESHGPCVGVTLDGVWPGIALSAEDFAEDIARRAPGAPGTTARREKDVPEIVSGLYEGHTTGAPLTLLFRNEDTRSEDYAAFRDHPRPGHADFVADIKFDGCNDPRGGGHFSGRLTLPLVAAGVVARKMVAEAVAADTDGEVEFGLHARLIEVGGAAEWKEALAEAVRDGDSLGGIVECVAEGLPVGLGEPFWNSVESLVSHALFSIPGVRGVEFGDGFAAARMRGSEHNDPFAPDGSGPLTNHAGGVNGGLTNGNPLVVRVAFKPTSSIPKAGIPGRHDACFALRCPVIVEAMVALVLADLVAMA